MKMIALMWVACTVVALSGSTELAKWIAVTTLFASTFELESDVS